MILSALHRIICQFRVPFGVALLLIAIGHEAVASTDSSWQSQPSWASTSDVPIPRKSRDSRHAINDVSPFSPSSNNVALDVGQVFLMGDLSSRYSDSIGAQLHYTYGVSDLFGFDASAGYSAHSDGKFSMSTLLTGLRTNLAWYDKVVPYLVFGMGFYRPSYQITTAGTGLSAGTTSSASLSPVLFGVHMGPGVDLELTKQLFFGAALTFHNVFGDSQVGPNGAPVDVGGTYTSFFLHAGVTF
jgi:hypothetical protein